MFGKPRFHGWLRLIPIFIMSLILLAISLTSADKAQALSAGNIAIIGVRADDIDGTPLNGNDDGFAWVPLVNLPAGAEIFFTDAGWTAGNTFRAAEGAIKYTAPAGGLPAGTVMLLDYHNPAGAGNSYTFTPSGGGGTYSNANDGNVSSATSAMSIPLSGENIFVFEGSTAAPTFLWGWKNEGGFDVDSTSNDETALPAGLTVGTNAVSVSASNLDNTRYIGPTNGTTAALSAAIANSSNWEGVEAFPFAGGGNDITNGTLSGGFTVTNGSPTATPTPIPPTSTPPSTGTIIIIKDTVPDDSQNFSFTTTGGLSPSNFSLDDDAVGPLGNSQTLNNVTPGQYMVRELAVPGWANTNITCDDGASAVPSTVDVTGRIVTINVEAGETVTCTFENQPTGLVINEFDYDQPTPPTSDSAEFIELKNTSGAAINLDAYTLVLINGASGGAAPYNTIALPNVSLSAGDYFVICANSATVANCDLDVLPNTNFIQNGGSQPDAIALMLDESIIDTVSYEGSVIAPYVEGSGNGLVDTITPAEVDRGLSRETDGVDTNINNSDFIRRCITPGEANVAPSNNCRPTGTITIIKDTVPNDGQDFNFTTTGGLPQTSFILDDDNDPTRTNNISFNDVEAGSYTVTEAADADYYTSVSCVDPDGGTTVSGATATIDLDGGETVTCTFTNSLITASTVVVQPGNLNGWGTLEETPTGSVNFVSGPATPPLSNGSVEFMLDDTTGGVLVGTQQYAGLRFDQIVDLEYSTYNTVGNNLVAPALQFNVDYDLTDSTTSWQGRLVFEPYQDPGNTVTDGIWQTWDPLDGRWWSSGTPIVGDSPAAQTCPHTSPCDWNTILSLYPDAGVQTGILSGVLFKAGSNWPAGYKGSVDKFVIQVANNITTFDFEPGQGTIVIVKDTVPNDGQDFNFTTTGGLPLASFILDDDSDPVRTNNISFNNVDAGEYTVTEAATAGYDTTLSCEDPSGGTTTSDATATIDLAGGETVTCTYTNTAQPGTITIKKNVAGSGFADLDFDFIFDGTTPFALSENDTAGYVENNLPAGTYNVTESVPTGWDLASVNCGTGQNNTPAVNGVNIVLEAGEDVVCTFNNSAEAASITIIKEVVYVADIDVDSDRNFSFFSTELGNFILDDPLTDDTDGITNTIVFNDQAFGEYTVTENPNGNWNQSVVCEGDNDVTYTDPDIGATIDLGPGENVVCTFTNERVTYDLTYEKVLANGTPVPFADWEFTLASLLNLVPGDIDQNFGTVTTIGGAGGTSTLTLPLDAYKVGEVVPSNYDLVQIDCGDGGLSTSPPTNDQFTIILDQDLTCTFTNQTTKAEITLNKVVINNHGGTAGANDFGLSIGGTPVNSGQTILVDANVAVAVDEVGLAGYDFVSITGDDKCPAVLGGTLTPAPGEEISCTITNDDQPGTLVIIKDTVPNDPQDFDFTVTGGLIPASFQLDDDSDFTLPNSKTYSGIAAGTYEVTETAVPGFETFISCVDASGDTTVSGNKATAKVALGETVTCTFTNEKQIPEISIDDVSIVEGTGGTTTLEFTVTRTNNYFATSVKANSADGTADSPADFGAIVNEMVNFAPGGSLSKVVSVNITTDAIVEADETFFLNLSDAVNGTIADPQGKGTILNDDKATLKLSGGTSRTETDSGQVAYIFYALLLDEVQGGFTLDLATKDLTATAADGDYDPVSVTLTFSGDFGGNVDERHTVTVYVNGDHKVEPDEAFAMQIVGGPVTPLASDIMVTTEVGRFDLDFHTAKIFNDDSAKLTLTGVSSKDEGDSGFTSFTFTAELDNPVAGGFKVRHETSNGSASNLSDFVDNDGTWTFSGTAGETKTVTVRVRGDELVEADETFYFSLGSFTNTSLAGDLSTVNGTKTVTIQNDDTAIVTLSGGNQMKLEGDSGTTAFTFQATLDADVDGGFDLSYAINSGTASADDYVGNGGTVRFDGNAGDTKTITVLVNGDSDGEAHETFFVELSGATADKSGVTIGTSGGGQKATIENDDAAVFFIDVSQTQIDEGAVTFPISVTLSNALAVETTVEYQTSAGSATAGADYDDVSGTLTFAPGELVKVIHIPVTDDGIHEADETLTLTLLNPDGVSFGNPSTAELTIIDDEPTPVLNFEGSPLSVGESDGSLTVEVMLTGPSAATVTVDVVTLDDSAKAGDDYTAIAQTLTFAPGETSKTVTLAILPDAVYEGDEKLKVKLTNASNADLGIEATEVVTIIEDDVAPSLSVAAGSAVQPQSGNGTMLFTVTLDQPAAVDISVDFSTQDGTATAGSDYEATSGTLTIPAGNTSGTISVTIYGGELASAGTFSLLLANLSDGELDSAAASVSGTIEKAIFTIYLPVMKR